MRALDIIASAYQNNVGGELVTQGSTGGVNPTTLDLLMVDLEPNSTAVVRVLVAARRPDNGASKCWDASAEIKRTGSTVTIGAARFGANADALVSVADGTPMAGVTIALATNGTNFGVRCTGPAGTPVNWTASLVGLVITD